LFPNLLTLDEFYNYKVEHTFKIYTNKIMVSKKVENALNKQIELEAASSQYYLAMASWAETQGLEGVAAFLYRHSDEERVHMLKLVKYVNERGGKALIPALKEQPQKFQSVQFVFQEVLKHEELVSHEINNLVDTCLKEKDYTTHNFLQWYVSEQIEEEALSRRVLDKLKFIGNDKSGLYFFDRDLSGMSGGEIPIQK
jgi:ferritin